MKKFFDRKHLVRFFLIFLGFLFIAELVLRFGFDLGEKPLYTEDPYCEYRMTPNQDISRFHRVFQTNSYGMRSPEISRKSKSRILLLGDSVLNGGSDVDQSNLINYVLCDQLKENYGVEIDVGNISAGSWGVENAYQFLVHQIDFEYDLIVLVFSSHDYNDNMHFRKVVGEQPAWPDKQPTTAISDFIVNGVYPKVKSIFSSNYNYLEGFDDSQVNPGWMHFMELSDSLDLPMIFYHHPEVSETESGEYNEKGQKLKHMFDSTSVYYINGIDCTSKESYVDNIHTNEKGHQAIADCLYRVIVENNLLNLDKK